MKNIFTLLFSFIFLFSISGYSQQNNWCGSTEKMEQAIINGDITAQELQNRIMRIVSMAPNGSRVGPYTIPVVFHIIHSNGTGNISQVQIQSALDVLNEDFNRTNVDAANTRNTTDAPFLPRAADVQITFKLAKRDPNGVCTNGIVRVNAPQLSFEAGDNVKSTSLGGSDSWDVDKYLNIWVVNTIAGAGGAGITLGYATLPYLGIGADYGIVVRHDYMAKNGIGTSVSDGRTLTHEMGHALGLLHTFQGPFFGGTTGCHSTDCANNGDYICDTPPADVSTQGCNVNLNTCSQIPTNSAYSIDVKNQIENYMSYDDCQNMFSINQKERIWSVLDSAAFPEMNNLVSASNLTFTGVNLPDVLCDVDFSGNRKIICAGDVVTFSDESFNAVTNRMWNFPGGTSANTTDQIIDVTYNTPGVYDVSLTVDDGTTFLDSTKVGYIRVLNNPGNLTSLVESFENYTQFPDYDKWVIEETGYDSSFVVSSDAAITGSKSLKLPIYGYSGYRFDELLSGVYDFSTASVDSNFYINFKYAYKNRVNNTSNTSNYLKIMISLDCGNSWSTRKVLSGNSFGSGVESSSWTPNLWDWIEDELMLPIPFVASSNFRFKFVIGTEDANNFYLEDINVYVAGQSSLGITEAYLDNQVKLYPNPTNNQFTIDLGINSPEFTTIELLDLSGRKMKSFIHNEKVAQNEQLNFDLSEVTSGIYFVRITVGGVEITRKLIKE